MVCKAVFPILAAVFAVGLGALVGGPQDVDVNDEQALNALNYAVVQHNRRSNDLYLSQVAEVARVQRQVVSGLKYIITVTMAKTPCRKGSTNQVCAIHQDPEKARPYPCTFTVMEQPWLHDIRLLDQKC